MEKEITLTNKQYSAIALLVYSNKSKKEVAQSVGVTEQTLFNWFENPTFVYELQNERFERMANFREELAKPFFEMIEAGFGSIKKTLESDGVSEIKNTLMIKILDNAKEWQHFFNMLSAVAIDADNVNTSGAMKKALLRKMEDKGYPVSELESI